MGYISKPITIDHDRWIVQRVGRHWMLYEAGEGAFAQEFSSWDDVVNFVEEEREIRGVK